MADVIARIKLSKGRVGFYDEKTRIHLTISKPTADIFAGMNTSNIKSAVRDGIVGLVWGSLDLETRQVKKDQHVTEDIAAKIEAAKAAKVKEEPKAEEVAPAKEVKTEEQPKEEAPAEEEPKTTKKKSNTSKKKAETVKEAEPEAEKAEEAAAE